MATAAAGTFMSQDRNEPIADLSSEGEAKIGLIKKMENRAGECGSLKSEIARLNFYPRALFLVFQDCLTGEGIAVSAASVPAAPLVTAGSRHPVPQTALTSRPFPAPDSPASQARRSNDAHRTPNRETAWRGQCQETGFDLARRSHRRPRCQNAGKRGRLNRRPSSRLLSGRRLSGAEEQGERASKGPRV